MARGNGGTRLYLVLCTITYEAIINKYLDKSKLESNIIVIRFLLPN